MTDQDAAEAYGKWWFLNGGMIHAHWKYKRYSAIRDLAMELPRAAWDAAIAHERTQAAASHAAEVKELVEAYFNWRKAVDDFNGSEASEYNHYEMQCLATSDELELLMLKHRARVGDDV